MEQEKFLELEYPALRAKELALMTAQRWQVWTLYLSLVTAFGIATVSIQNEVALYLPSLLPPLIAFLARYARHGEDVLKQVRKYLRKLERDHKHAGYEEFCNTAYRSSHGGHIDAIRDAFLLTQVCATAFVVIHLVIGSMIAVSVIVACVELAAMTLTYRWLRK